MLEPTTPQALLDELARLGVEVHATGDVLRLEGPTVVVPPALFDALRNAKPAILARLSTEAAARPTLPPTRRPTPQRTRTAETSRTSPATAEPAPPPTADAADGARATTAPRSGQRPTVMSSAPSGTDQGTPRSFAVRRPPEEAAPALPPGGPVASPVSAVDERPDRRLFGTRRSAGVAGSSSSASSSSASSSSGRDAEEPGKVPPWPWWVRPVMVVGLATVGFAYLLRPGTVPQAAEPSPPLQPTPGPLLGGWDLAMGPMRAGG